MFNSTYSPSSHSLLLTFLTSVGLSSLSRTAPEQRPGLCPLNAGHSVQNNQSCALRMWGGENGSPYRQPHWQAGAGNLPFSAVNFRTRLARGAGFTREGEVSGGCGFIQLPHHTPLRPRGGVSIPLLKCLPRARCGDPQPLGLPSRCGDLGVKGPLQASQLAEDSETQDQISEHTACSPAVTGAGVEHAELLGSPSRQEPLSSASSLSVHRGPPAGRAVLEGAARRPLRNRQPQLHFL